MSNDRDSHIVLAVCRWDQRVRPSAGELVEALHNRFALAAIA